MRPFLSILAVIAIGLAAGVAPAAARHGADDPAGHVRQSRGADDVATTSSATTPAGTTPAATTPCATTPKATTPKHKGKHRRRHGRHGGKSKTRVSDDAPGHVRHSGNDDGPNHR